MICLEVKSQAVKYYQVWHAYLIAGPTGGTAIKAEGKVKAVKHGQYTSQELSNTVESVRTGHTNLECRANKWNCRQVAAKEKALALPNATRSIGKAELHIQSLSLQMKKPLLSQGPQGQLGKQGDTVKAIH